MLGVDCSPQIPIHPGGHAHQEAPPTGLRSESAVQDPCCFSRVTWGPASSLHTLSLLSQVLPPASPCAFQSSGTWGTSLHPNLSIHTAGALSAQWWSLTEAPASSESDCSQFSDQHSAIILDPQSSLPVLSGRSSSGSISLMYTHTHF